MNFLQQHFIATDLSSYFSLFSPSDFFLALLFIVLTTCFSLLKDPAGRMGAAYISVYSCLDGFRGDSGRETPAALYNQPSPRRLHGVIDGVFA